MAKSKVNRRKRYQIEIMFDNWDADAVSASCEPLKNFYFLSWISTERGFLPDSQEISAITFLAYIIYERTDILKYKIPFLTHPLPDKQTLLNLKLLFAPGKDLLKITSGKKFKDMNKVKEGTTDIVVFKRGNNLLFNVDLLYTKTDWEVTAIRSVKSLIKKIG